MAAEPGGAGAGEQGEAMTTLAVIAISLLLTACCVLIHYEVLRFCSALFPKSLRAVRSKVLVLIGGVFLVHLVEICLFAVAYGVMVPFAVFGSIQGDFTGSAMDYFYFSITSYTTLGVGDLLPHGALRFLSGVQALVGFVLTGWSASFIYLAMERFWGQHRSRHSAGDRPRGP
jgi:hypothetical protein